MLQFDDRLQNRFRPGRAAGDVNIHRNNLVNALYHRVVVIKPAGGSAYAHGNNPLGVGHLFINLFQDRSLFKGYRTRHQKKVCLPGRKPYQLRAKAGDVKYRSGHPHKLDGAAGRAKGHGPEGVFLTPGQNRVFAGGKDRQCFYSHSRAPLL